jgi:hypothetical protein
VKWWKPWCRESAPEKVGQTSCLPVRAASCRANVGAGMRREPSGRTPDPHFRSLPGNWSGGRSPAAPERGLPRAQRCAQAGGHGNLQRNRGHRAAAPEDGRIPAASSQTSEVLSKPTPNTAWGHAAYRVPGRKHCLQAGCPQPATGFENGSGSQTDFEGESARTKGWREEDGKATSEPCRRARFIGMRRHVGALGRRDMLCRSGAGRWLRKDEAWHLMRTGRWTGR